MSQREIDNILRQLEEHVRSNTYHPIETDRLELKDLSSGNNWTELYKTICAFLNTRGGIVVVGIKERQKEKCFRFTGFDPNNEANLKLIPNKFTNDDGLPLDLSEFIRPDLMEVVPFLNGHVCIIFIEKLPDEQKYVLFNGGAYERRITGDHPIPDAKIDAQKELRVELVNAKELSYVPNSTLSDLDVDKLNEYIMKLNKDVKVETLKSDIPLAVSFLSRKKFIRGDDNNPTLLGMLVCGKYIYDKVGGRCQVDCYLNSGIEVADDKKVFKENIIQLMESSISFVFSKISTGVSLDKGGSTLFEYPERVIRETVNNALAHRDYSNERFTNITVVPNKSIEIRNPGRFRQEQVLRIDDDVQIRRIIPITKAQNPNLADVLKSFDRWEGKGWGMSSLTNFALNNSIDVPYFRLYAENDIGLFIQKGRVLDDEMNLWLDSFSKYILHKTGGRKLTIEQRTVLAHFFKSEQFNRLERYTVLLTPDNNHFEVIKDLETYGLVYKHPQSPALYPVYFVDRILTKKDFTDELRRIYGGAYDTLSNELKAVLEAIYLFNEYSLDAIVSANHVGNYLYLKKNRIVVNGKDYETFKRKTRTQINKLEKGGFIIRKIEGKADYMINNKFHRPNSMFD